MQFSDKLNFLMNISQTSNKALAAAISVDRSLISLLRNGKRKMPRNQDHIRHMAIFFAQHCTAEFQHHALAEMTGQSIFRSTIPVEIMADHLTNWLLGDSSVIQELLEGIQAAPPIPSVADPEPPVTISPQQTTFYYGIEGRRAATREMIKMIRNMESPCSILISSDDNLEWLFSDYRLSKEIQSSLIYAVSRGFTIHQIMPSVNYLNRYVESLHYWLPLYVTGQTTVYYYPRLRDNLYRVSAFLLPGHYVNLSMGIGINAQNEISLLTSDPELVKAYTRQYEEHLALCHHALITHTDPREFMPCFLNIASSPGKTIMKVSPLSANTLPEELLRLCIRQCKNIPVWEHTFQMCLDEIPHFEARLKLTSHIDMCPLATAEEVRSGKVPIASPYKTSDDHPCYTPKTYSMHLQNILRLMDQYDNYYFIPTYDASQTNYSLMVNENGLALLVRNTSPALMLELQRPEMVQACMEYLLRMADMTGYDGIQRTKIRYEINDLIRQLQD